MAMDDMNPSLSSKIETVKKRLRELHSVVVAFSGGLDSTVLLKLAVDTLGPARVLAVTGRSPSVPRADLENVARLAAEAGACHEFISTGEFENPDYRANPPDRCYYCKSDLYVRLRRLAEERGLRAVLCGTNADDLGDFRPGLRAADQFQVQAPLAEAGLSKAEVRQIARLLGLSVAEKPASPCLSSRIPYGERVEPEKLRQIDAAESFLRDLGFGECRVRHHGSVARIEVPAEQIGRLAEPEMRSRVVGQLRELGFQYVTLDLRGFRSGSLNEVLPIRPTVNGA